jgi:hypothetical protein
MIQRKLPLRLFELLQSVTGRLQANTSGGRRGGFPVRGGPNKTTLRTRPLKSAAKKQLNKHLTSHHG